MRSLGILDGIITGGTNEVEDMRSRSDVRSGLKDGRTGRDGGASDAWAGFEAVVGEEDDGEEGEARGTREAGRAAMK